MRRWVVPLALALGIAGGGGGALVMEARASAASAAVGGATVRTPVLSVRRLPSAVAAPIADRRVRADLDAWAADTSSSSCAVVVDESGQAVLDLRGELPLVPASTLKLATATASLLQMGRDARFRTAVVGSAPVDGTVTGDLTLVGGGDPILATAGYAARFKNQPQTFTDLAVLAQRISDAGVRRIAGSVVGDESRYDRDRYVAGWPLRYITQDVVGPLSALAVNDGFAAFPPAWDVPRALVEAPDPAAQAAAVLTLLLVARGVDVVGAPRSGRAPSGMTEVAAIESPPLRDVLAEMLQESDNSTAELLMKEIGRGALDPSTAGGRVEATRLLTDAGVDLSGVTVADGSGLSLDNRVTCDLLVALLDRPGTGPVLRAGLSVAGKTGTLAERFVGTPLAGHLRAKTGSLNIVAGIAGLVTDDDGSFTFAYLVNGSPSVDEAAVAASQERLGEILLSYPRVPEVSLLGPLPASNPQQR
jgi:D-alanyl-D-alanine carboxypeptidase/D-alanyl-D-alanine-endopeptidase (penicillin-binding protein 4)